MKFRVTLLVFILGIYSIHGILAQSGNTEGPIIPLQPDKSILFGTDTYISNQPLQDQRNGVICSAFNGWLYAAYSYYNHTVLQAAFTVLRSKDNGVNWSVILNGPTGSFHTTITKLDILVCGHDTANLKIFLGICIQCRLVNKNRIKNVL